MHSDTPVVSITGFISRPTLTRNGAQHIFFFVNDRFIRDKLLHRAMMDGYRNLIPHGRYPVVFLFYEIDPSEIDINVHPTKQEIKFSREDAIFSTTFRAIRQAWDMREQESAGKDQLSSESQEQKAEHSGKSASVTPLPMRPQERETVLPPPPLPSTQTGNSLLPPVEPPPHRTQPPSLAQSGSFSGASHSAVPGSPSTQNPTQQEPNTQQNPSIHREDAQKTPVQMDEPAQEARERVENLNRKPLEIIHRSLEPADEQEEKGILDLLHSSRKPDELFGVESLEQAGTLTVLAQLMNKYILAESDRGLYIIDQHAAHERLKFEEFLQASERAPLASQSMLFPITLELAPDEVTLIEEN